MQLIVKGAQAHYGEQQLINGPLVREGVKKKAADLRQKLKKIFNGRRVSLSADFATCNAVDFLG